MQKKRRIYDGRTRKKAVSVAVTLKSVSDAARKLKIPRSTLRTWVSRADLQGSAADMRRSALFDQSQAPDEDSLRKLGYCAAIALAHRVAHRFLNARGQLDGEAVQSAVMVALQLTKHVASKGLPQTAGAVKRAQKICYAVSKAGQNDCQEEDFKAIQAAIYASGAVGASGSRTPKKVHSMAAQVVALVEGDGLKPLWDDFFWLLEKKTDYAAPVPVEFFKLPLLARS